MPQASILIHAALHELVQSRWPSSGNKTRFSVVVCLYIQAREIRYTTVSIIYFSCVTESGYSQFEHQDIDVVVESGHSIDRFKIRNQIAESDRRFTVNTEKIWSHFPREGG